MRDNVPPAVTISRQVLFSRVWSTPMQKLAPEFGITDRGLAKICRNNSIPYPTIGHWTRKAAGKTVFVPKLPKAKTGVSQEIKITPMRPKPELEVPAWLAATLVKIRADRRLGVIGEPRQLHPAIAKVAERETGLRCRRLLDAILRGLERHSGRVSEAGHRCYLLDAFGEKVEFSLLRQTKTVEESGRDEIETLTFSINTGYPGRQRARWSDRPNRPLETLLPHLVETLFIGAAVLAERRRRREEKAKQRELAAIEQWRQESIMKEDRKRWDRLTALMLEYEIGLRMCHFLDQIETRGFDASTIVEDSTLGEMMTWARQRAAAAIEIDAQAVFAMVLKRPWKF